MEIIFHKSVNLDDEALSEVAQTAAVTKDLMSVNGHSIRVVVRHEVLDRLADIDGVKAIQDVHKMVLYNNKARQILAVNSILENPSTSFQGDGPIADTGLDKGSTTDMIFSQGLTDDPDGHGTHVAGSAVGDGKSDKLGENKIIRGAAPKAKLAFQSVGSKESDGTIGLDMARIGKMAGRAIASWNANGRGGTGWKVLVGRVLVVVDCRLRCSGCIRVKGLLFRAYERGMFLL